MIDGKDRSLGIYDTEQEAWDAINAALRLHGPVSGGLTLANWGERWLERRETDGFHRSIDRDRSRWLHHVAACPFIDRPIRKIERKHIVAWLRELAQLEAVQTIKTKRGVMKRPTGRTLSRGTVVHCLNLLRMCLHDAADDGLISVNPAMGVRAPKMQPSAPKWTFLTPDEIEHVLTFERANERSRLVWQVAIYTGLRKGEMWGLRWENVFLDGDRPRIEVRRSYDGPVKSRTSVRDVPLLPPARDALRKWREWGGVVRARGLVWPSDLGGCHHNSYTARWKEWRAEMLDRKVRFHDLRHTCASHLVMGTWGRVWTTEEVKELMGHSSVTVTQRYTHLAPDSIHGAAKTMEKHFRKR